MLNVIHNGLEFSTSMIVVLIRTYTPINNTPKIKVIRVARIAKPIRLRIII